MEINLLYDSSEVSCEFYSYLYIYIYIFLLALANSMTRGSILLVRAAERYSYLMITPAVKGLPANAGVVRSQVWSLGREAPLEEGWQPTPVISPGESHGQRNLAGYSPQGGRESDMPEEI